MQVTIEYHGKWLEWCVCTAQGEVLVDCFQSYTEAVWSATIAGWEVV